MVGRETPDGYMWFDDGYSRHAGHLALTMDAIGEPDTLRALCGIVRPFVNGYADSIPTYRCDRCWRKAREMVNA